MSTYAASRLVSLTVKNSKEMRALLTLCCKAILTVFELACCFGKTTSPFSMQGWPGKGCRHRQFEISRLKEESVAPIFQAVTNSSSG